MKIDFGWCLWDPRPGLWMPDTPCKPPDASTHPPNPLKSPWRDPGSRMYPKSLTHIYIYIYICAWRSRIATTVCLSLWRPPPISRQYWPHPAPYPTPTPSSKGETLTKIKEISISDQFRTNPDFSGFYNIFVKNCISGWFRNGHDITNTFVNCELHGFLIFHFFLKHVLI